MAAPALTAGTTGVTSTAGTSHVVDLPVGTGSKFVVIETMGSAGNTVSATDWSIVKQLGVSTGRELFVLAPDSGSSAATSLTVTSSTSSTAAFVGFYSSDGDIANAVFSTGAAGVTGTNLPDPDAVTVSLGDYRIVAFGGQTDGRRTISTYPTNYADTNLNPGISANNAPRLFIASRGMTAITTEDPGVFTATANIGVHALGTLAIPELAGSFTGTVAVTQADQTSAASGTVVEPSITGTASPVQEDQTSSASGTFTPSAFTGTVAVTQADQTSAASGTVASYPGGLPAAAVIAWYDAQDLAAGALSSWADQGPNGEAALAQATGANQPVVGTANFGGLKSAVFDGVNDVMDMTLAGSYSTDFAIIVTFELLTYPTGSAAVMYSTGAIPNKNILGADDVENPPGFVVMSGPEGTQAEHHHGVADQTYLETTPSRFVMTQRVRDDGLHKLWDRDLLVLNLTDSAGGDPLNNLVGIKVGAREDNSRYANMALASVLLVDVTQTDEATLLAARDDLMTDYSVAAATNNRTGTVAVTQADQTSSASGTTTPPAFTGTVAVTQEAQTSSVSGTVAPPAFTGSVAATQDAQTSAAEGTVTSAGVSGSVAVTQDDQTSTAAGTFTPQAITGTVAVVQDNQTSTASGDVTTAGIAGSVAVTQENQVSNAAGVFTPAGITGTAAATQADQTSSAEGLVVSPSFTGTVSVTQESQTGSATGTAAAPAFTGTVNVTQDDQIGNASGPGLRTRLEGRSVSGLGTEGSPSGVGLEGTRL